MGEVAAAARDFVFPQNYQIERRSAGAMLEGPCSDHQVGYAWQREKVPATEGGGLDSNV